MGSPAMQGKDAGIMPIGDYQETHSISLRETGRQPCRKKEKFPY
jgi:hypothetical protein